METVRLVTALLLPWLLGVVWLRYCWNPISEGGWATLLGYGYVLGILATVLTMLAVDLAELPQNFFIIASILAVLTGLGLWLSRGIYRQPPNSGISAPAWRTLSTGYKVLLGILLMLIVIRFAGFAMEIVWRPLYPWDAWVNWAPKARVWFEHQALIPFVDRQTWLSTDQAYNLSNEQANGYPPLVPLVQLWMSLAIDRWDESLINLPWLFVAAALGLAFYGQARSWGVSPLPATAFVYFLFSMPLIDTHVALAGYAELWLATFYALAAMALAQWLRTGNRRQGAVALILIAACPLIKREGAVWLMTFIPAIVVACLTLKQLALGAGLFVVAIVIWFGFGGFSAEMPGLGKIHLQPDLLQIPHLGRFELGFWGNLEPVLQNLLVLDNWHLLWYLFVVLAAYSMPRILRNRLLFDFTILISTGLAMLFVLFFMTDARWGAVLYTSINRLFFHMTPALLFYLLILINHLLNTPFHRATASVSQS